MEHSTNTLIVETPPHSTSLNFLRPHSTYLIKLPHNFYILILPKSTTHKYHTYMPLSSTLYHHSQQSHHSPLPLQSGRNPSIIHKCTFNTGEGVLLSPRLMEKKYSVPLQTIHSITQLGWDISSWGTRRVNTLGSHYRPNDVPSKGEGYHCKHCGEDDELQQWEKWKMRRKEEEEKGTWVGVV